MANHKTGAQRYNDRMDKIFAESERLGNHTLHGSTEKKKEMAGKLYNIKDRKNRRRSSLDIIRDKGRRKDLLGIRDFSDKKDPLNETRDSMTSSY